jgi:hypothetical protein
MKFKHLCWSIALANSILWAQGEPVPSSPFASPNTTIPFGLRSWAHAQVFKDLPSTDNHLLDLESRPYVAGGLQQLSIQPGLKSDWAASLLTQTQLGTLFTQFRKTDTNQVTKAQIGWAATSGKFGFSMLWSDTTIAEEIHIGDTAITQTNVFPGQMLGVNLGYVYKAWEFFGSYQNATRALSQTTEINSNPAAKQTFEVETWTLGSKLHKPSWDIDLRYTLINRNAQQKFLEQEEFEQVEAEHRLKLLASQLIPARVPKLKPILGVGVEIMLADPLAGYRYETRGLLQFGAEYSLFKNWNLMTGYQFQHQLYRETLANDDYFETHSTPASIGNVGLTYIQGPFTIESVISAQVADNGPSSLFEGEGLIQSTTLTLNF